MNLSEFDPGEQFNPDVEMTERTKWICDGAVTLSSAALMLQEYADYLVGLEKAGWQLTVPSEDGYLHIENSSLNN